MKLSDAEKNNRLSEVFLKKSDREYYDLEITEDHQKLYDQYVAGEINHYELEKQLFDLMQQKTSIVIAHRLSTLLTMDRILVFDQGRIIQDGSHEELLRKAGLYKTLWEAQIGGFLPQDKLGKDC